MNLPCHFRHRLKRGKQNLSEDGFGSVETGEDRFARRGKRSPTERGDETVYRPGFVRFLGGKNYWRKEKHDWLLRLIQELFRHKGKMLNEELEDNSTFADVSY